MWFDGEVLVVQAHRNRVRQPRGMIEGDTRHGAVDHHFNVFRRTDLEGTGHQLQQAGAGHVGMHGDIEVGFGQARVVQLALPVRWLGLGQVDDNALVGHNVVEHHPDHFVELDQRRGRVVVVVLGDVAELGVQGEGQQATRQVGKEQVQAFRVQARVGQ
ncbi:hypothetical protein D3C75_1006700 [compost metagenome]